ncbi:MAG: hypothetical protein M0R37_03845 [Bacteroidales bacterium]|nr:hypothetical protein [Bacteroidales bacterium]
MLSHCKTKSMELNKKTINTVVNALQVAKKVTELSILVSTDPFLRTNQPLCDITDGLIMTTEQIKEYDVLISQFKGLSERQDYQLLEE